MRAIDPDATPGAPRRFRLPLWSALLGLLLTFAPAVQAASRALARLDVRLSPAKDPWKRPWLVQVLEPAGANDFKVIAESPTAVDGTWTHERLWRGARYVLRVKTAENDGWWMDKEPFAIPGERLSRNVRLEARRVKGTVRFGKNPLRATLVFGTEGAKVAVRLRSDRQGRFRGLLPRAGEWPVTVASDAPRVTREVALQVQDTDGEAGLEIFIPSHVLEGEVVDEKGKPVTQGTLLVTERATADLRGHLTRRDLARDAPNGRFLLEDLTSGHYTLEVNAPGLESNEVVALVNPDGTTEPRFVRIVAKRQRGFKGRVVSEASGSPVEGAAVYAVDALKEVDPAERRVLTDADGKFELQLNPSTEQLCLAIFPAAFAGIVVRAPAVEEEQPFPVPSDGGVLKIELPPTTSITNESLFLVRGGCAIPPALLEKRAAEIAAQGATAPMTVEKGHWALCGLTRAQLKGALQETEKAGNCQGVSVIPGEVRTLKVVPRP